MPFSELLSAIYRKCWIGYDLWISGHLRGFSAKRTYCVLKMQALLLC